MKFVLVYILLMFVITACSSSSNVQIVRNPTAMTATNTPTSAHPTLWYYKKGVVYRFDPVNQKINQVDLPEELLSGTWPLMSHDGHVVAFADRQGLKLFRTSDAQITLTVPHKRGDKKPVDLSSATYMPFLWSPDDRWLLITIGRYEQEGLGFLNIENSEIVEIAAGEQRSITCGFSGATWSPDSASIISTSDIGYVCEWGQAFPGVNLASPASPRLTSIFTYTLESKAMLGTSDPAWRPNTDQIVFSQEVSPESSDPIFPDPTFQLYTIHSNGKGAHQLTSNSKGHIYSPVWDASGSRLFYSSRKVDNMGDGVYVSRPDGTESHRLVAGEGIVPISVSPDGNYLVLGPGYAAVPFFSEAPSWSDEIWVLDLRTEETLLSGSGKFVGWQVKSN